MDVLNISKSVKKYNGVNSRMLLITLAFVYFLFVNTDRTLYLIGLGCFYAFVTGAILMKNTTYGYGSTYFTMASVFKYHAFKVDDYFRLVLKKIALTTTLMAILVGIANIIMHNESNIPYILVLLVIPYIIFFAYKKYFVYRMTHEPSTGQVVILSVIMAFVMFFVVMAIAVMLLFEAIMVYAMFSDDLGMAGFNDAEVVYKAYYNNIFIVIFILILFFAFAEMIGKKKIKRWIRISVFALIIVLSVISILVEKNNNVVVTDKSIIYTRHGNISEYSYLDVETYLVHYQKSEIAMTLTMKDGKKIEVMSSEYTNTDGWDEQYYSLYNFAADFAKKLSASGAKGSLKDADDLREHVKTFDQPCIDGVDEIIEFLK